MPASLKARSETRGFFGVFFAVSSDTVKLTTGSRFVPHIASALAHVQVSEGILM